MFGERRHLWAFIVLGMFKRGRGWAGWCSRWGAAILENLASGNKKWGPSEEPEIESSSHSSLVITMRQNISWWHIRTNPQRWKTVLFHFCSQVLNHHIWQRIVIRFITIWLLISLYLVLRLVSELGSQTWGREEVTFGS